MEVLNMSNLLDLFCFKYNRTDFHELNLDWLISDVTRLAEEVNVLDSWKATHVEEYEELKTFMDNINSGNFPESMYDSMRKWLETNAIDIVGEMVKHVYFGLTDDGYFMVTIPQQWRELIFNTTGYDITVSIMPEYGHLTISY
jgi:hypothetical protein